MRTETLINNLKGLSEIFEIDLKDDMVRIWIKVFDNFTDEEFVGAITKYMIDPNSKFFPKPGQIYAIAKPTPDKESEATLMVEQIFMLLGPCGADDFGCMKAKKKLSEVQWAYVENLGGWAKFARDMQLLDNGDVMTAKSQARKAIMGLIDRKRQDMPLLLGSEPQGLVSLTEFAKKIADERFESP